MLMLKVERYAATGAENGRVGLELARSDPPDLILCDVMMPEMDGFAVLEAVASRAASCRNSVQSSSLRSTTAPAHAAA